MTEEVITFRGVTEPGARVFSGRYAADVDTDGTWSLVLVLAPGDNGAVLVARDSAGNESKVRLRVTLNRCADMTPAVIPDSATNPSSVTGDLDGNGLNDTVTVYYDDADHTSWVHMALDYGYAASVLIEDADWDPEAISTVTFDSSNAVALIEVGHRATTERFGLFALIGCDAVYTTSDSDGTDWPLILFVGASMTYAFGTTCTPEGVVQRSSQIVDSGDDWDLENDIWDISDDEYKYDPDRGHFDLISSTTIQMTWSEIQ